MHEGNLKKLKTELKQSKEENYKIVIEGITTEMNDKEKRLVDTVLVDGNSNCRISVRIF